MIIDEVRGRMSYYAKNRQLNKRSKQVYGKKIFGARHSPSRTAGKQMKAKGIEIHVVAAMSTRLRLSQHRLERTMRRRSMHNSLHGFDRVTSLMRERLAATERQIKLIEDMGDNPGSYFLYELGECKRLRDTLRNDLAILS